MFSKRRRLFAAFIPSLLTTLAALWSAILSHRDSNAVWLPFVYVGSVALVSTVSAYFTQLKPARDLEKGIALAKGVPVLYDLESNDPSSLNLPYPLLQATTHLTAIWSWPIYEVDKSGRQTGKLLGVVNLDTTRTGGAAKLMSKADFRSLRRILLLEAISFSGSVRMDHLLKDRRRPTSYL